MVEYESKCSFFSPGFLLHFLTNDLNLSFFSILAFVHAQHLRPISKTSRRPIFCFQTQYHYCFQGAFDSLFGFEYCGIISQHCWQLCLHFRHLIIICFFLNLYNIESNPRTIRFEHVCSIAEWLSLFSYWIGFSYQWGPLTIDRHSCNRLF